MATPSQFEHEEIAAVPRGWKVRSITHPDGSIVRLAFPPGRRKKGSGKLISILHPKGNPKKTKTREQVEKAQDKAVRFLRDVVGDSDRADEIADMSVEEYAEKKKITLSNPSIASGWNKAGERYRALVLKEAKVPDAEQLAKSAWEDLPGHVKRAVSGKPAKNAFDTPRERAAYAAGLARGSGALTSAAETLRRRRSTRIERMMRSGLGRRNPYATGYKSIPMQFRSSPEAWRAFESAYEEYKLTHPVTTTYSTFAQLDDAQKAGMRAVERLYRQTSKTNPNGEIDLAAERFREFHGEDPEHVMDVHEAEIGRDTYSGLGKLYQLKISKDGKHFTLDFESCGVVLARAAEGQQLYIVGGDQDCDAILNGQDKGKDFVNVGMIDRVAYETRKDFDKFRDSVYEHKFGEEGGEKPWLLYNRLSKRLFIVGGDYTIAKPGIIN